MKRLSILLLTLIAVVSIVSCTHGGGTAGRLESPQITDNLRKLFDQYSPSMDSAHSDEYAKMLKQSLAKSDMQHFIQALGDYDVKTIKGIIDLVVEKSIQDGGKSEADNLNEMFKYIKEKMKLNKNQEYAVLQGEADVSYCRIKFNIE